MACSRPSREGASYTVMSGFHSRSTRIVDERAEAKRDGLVGGLEPPGGVISEPIPWGLDCHCDGSGRAGGASLGEYHLERVESLCPDDRSVSPR